MRNLMGNLVNYISQLKPLHDCVEEINNAMKTPNEACTLHIGDKLFNFTTLNQSEFTVTDLIEYFKYIEELSILSNDVMKKLILGNDPNQYKDILSNSNKITDFQKGWASSMIYRRIIMK